MDVDDIVFIGLIGLVDLIGRILGRTGRTWFAVGPGGFIGA